MKKCKRCGIDREKDKFRSRLIRGKPYTELICKVCQAAACVERHKKRYATDAEYRERMNAAARKYLKSDKGREASARANKKYRESESGAAVIKAATRNWSQNNKHAIVAIKRKRDALKKQAVPGWADLEAIKRIYAERQKIELETGMPHHVDHIVPLNSRLVCGLHCEANLRVIPGAENMSKRNRWWPDMPD